MSPMVQNPFGRLDLVCCYLYRDETDLETESIFIESKRKGRKCLSCGVTSCPVLCITLCGGY
jgi:hypothetical protein